MGILADGDEQKKNLTVFIRERQIEREISQKAGRGKRSRIVCVNETDGQN